MVEDNCADLSKREMLQSLGLVRERVVDHVSALKASTAPADYETSTDALVEYMSELGLADEMRQARVDLAAIINDRAGEVTLRTLRLQAGLSQRDLALRINSNQPHISALEAGKEGMSLDFAERLANALGTDIAAVSVAVKAGKRG